MIKAITFIDEKDLKVIDGFKGKDIDWTGIPKINLVYLYLNN